MHRPDKITPHFPQLESISQPPPPFYSRPMRKVSEVKRRFAAQISDHIAIAIRRFRMRASVSKLCQSIQVFRI